jgi:tetratricopeptide (TPR) repeat protein
MPFVAKFPLAEYLLEHTGQKRANWKVTAFSLVVYGLALTIPVMSTWGYVTVLPVVLRIHKVKAEEIATIGKESDWKRLIAQAETPEERWQVHMQTGAWLYESEELEEAARYYQQAWEEAESFGPEDPRLGETLSRLGLTAFDPEEAREYLEQALAIQERHSSPDDVKLAETLEGLAWTCDLWGEESELAVSCLERALAMRRKAQGPDHPAIAEDLKTLAALYERSGEMARSEEAWVEALAIHERAQGIDAVTLLPTLQELARFYAVQGRYGEAENYRRREVAIREKGVRKADGLDELALAEAKVDLGRLLAVETRLGPAESFFQQAIKHIRSAVAQGVDPQKTNAKLLPALLDLAYVYAQEGTPQLAGPYLVEAEELLLTTKQISMEEHLADLEQRIHEGGEKPENPWEEARWVAHAKAIQSLHPKENDGIDSGE